MAVCTYTATSTRDSTELTWITALFFSNGSTAGGGSTDYTIQAQLDAWAANVLLGNPLLISVALTAAIDGFNVVFTVVIITDPDVLYPTLFSEYGILGQPAISNSLLFTNDCETVSTADTCIYRSSITKVTGATYSLCVSFNSLSICYAVASASDAGLQTLLLATAGVEHVSLSFTADGTNTIICISVETDPTIIKPISFSEITGDDTTAGFSSTCPPLVCDTCYQMVFDNCTGSMAFPFGFFPAVSYIIRAKDHLDNVYKQTVTSSAGGVLTYDPDAALVPSGVFHQWGIYEFTFRFTSAPLVDVSFTIDDIEYTCINVTFEPVTNTTA